MLLADPLKNDWPPRGRSSKFTDALALAEPLKGLKSGALALVNFGSKPVSEVGAQQSNPVVALAIAVDWRSRTMTAPWFVVVVRPCGYRSRNRRHPALPPALRYAKPHWCESSSTGCISFNEISCT